MQIEIVSHDFVRSFSSESDLLPYFSGALREAEAAVNKLLNAANMKKSGHRRELGDAPGRKIQSGARREDGSPGHGSGLAPPSAPLKGIELRLPPWLLSHICIQLQLVGLQESVNLWCGVKSRGSKHATQGGGLLVSEPELCSRPGSD